jgi:hypothetical protein
MIIELYVCPTSGCGSYYGTDGMPDLTVKNQHTHGINFEVIPQDQWHSRAECPSCRARGERVERQLVRIDLKDHRFTISAPAEAARAVVQ